ncbi:ATP-binding protein [Methylobacterium pseudosasicola]|uniref:histidine kinase n=1 Tax=Methylobacterium pseudosasicola TaxID=582667 RepID=A0A1I4UKL0_9HYPH|nr:ATP-binding protein [Methylobacterium pseudosasicola]SFM89451.1 PAS domain S-box-containing protein [Methylobacterium pseudosasicola]
MSKPTPEGTPFVAEDGVRLAALDAYGILDTPAEQGFEDLTLLASRICDAPVALVSLVDRDRQWFKARVGFPRCETDLDSSVCKFVLAEQDVLVIPDLALDPRTTANPLVTGEPFIRFYAGAPLRTPEGMTIGSLCVIDHEPRPAGLTEGQRESLTALARQATTLLELRRKGETQSRAEAALTGLNVSLGRQVARSNADLDRVWRNAQDLQLIIDAEGVFQAVSPSATRLLGWAPEEMVGRNLFAFTHPDGHQASREALAQALREPLPPHRNRYLHKDGSDRWIAWVTTPEDGLIYCYGRDVTVETEQAHGLLQTEEALRQSQKLEAIGQLTGSVAHDFNNLLTVIKSSSDLLKRPNLAEERRTRYVAAISDTVDRAARLTGQLLAFARRQTLQPEVFAACDGVRAISEMMGTLTGARIKLGIDLPEHRLFIDADPSQFDTALVNMAVNARDAMDGDGRIDITVSPADAMPARRAHGAIPGPYVAISLSDTGSGIAPDRIDRIFEPFFTTKEIGKGTGLGLSQVFGFAKQSGGDVMVSSVVGEGTTFTLYLPRVAEARRKATKAIGPDMLTVGHDTRVLVVEDNADVGSFSVQALIELGYLPILAAGGEEALAVLAPDAARFDVVFTDVVMPGMSGIDLAEEIRRRHPGLPVVLTSGYSHVLAKEGTHGFELLQKPYSIEQLSRTLHNAKRGRQGDRILDA